MTEPELPRQDGAVMVIGGPTTVVDLGGLRIVSDPTFDAPGPHGYLTKTAGPAVTEGQLGPVDLVLVSHDNHPDNLDDRGRAFALAAGLVLTTTSGARRLGGPAAGLAPWTGHTVRRPGGGGLTVTAVPAVHGPEDGERDADGFINCEVIGFVLSGAGLPTVYLSGDNASIGTCAQIAQRISGIDAAVLTRRGPRRGQVPRPPAQHGQHPRRGRGGDSGRPGGGPGPLRRLGPLHRGTRRPCPRLRQGLRAQLHLGEHGTWIPLQR